MYYLQNYNNKKMKIYKINKYINLDLINFNKLMLLHNRFQNKIKQ